MSQKSKNDKRSTNYICTREMRDCNAVVINNASSFIVTIDRSNEGHD